MHHQIREFELDNLKNAFPLGVLNHVKCCTLSCIHGGPSLLTTAYLFLFLPNGCLITNLKKNLKQVLLTSSAKIMFKTCQSKKKHVVMSSLFYISSKIPSSIHATQVKLEAVGSSVCSSIVFEQNPRLLEPAFGILIV